MRILTIGSAKTMEILTNFLAEDENLLVFTTSENTNANFINIHAENIEELKDFALANEINLTITAGNNLPDIDYLTEFGESNLAILAPDKEASKIFWQKIYL